MRRQYGLNDRLDFGKYRDELVSTVIRDNPSYIDWCLENIEWFRLDQKAEDELDFELSTVEKAS